MKLQSEKGTILLTTLLIMAIMAGVAIAVLEDIRFAVKRTINVQNYVQADWMARDTQAAATSLAGQISGVPNAAKNQILIASEPRLFPVENGFIQLTLFDASNCFNLNALIDASGRADFAARQQFVRLAEVLGVDAGRARRLGMVLTDWIDSDTQALPSGAEDGYYLRRDPPHRTANTALSSPEELRSLIDMTPEIYTLLRPHVCTAAAGQPTQFNLNTASAENAPVLAALLGGVNEAETALRLIAERPAGGYPDKIVLVELPVFGGTLPENSATQQIGTVPNILGVETEITIGTARRNLLLAFDGLDTGELVLTYRAQGPDARRPAVKSPREATP